MRLIRLTNLNKIQGKIAFMVSYKGMKVSCCIENYKQGEGYEKTHISHNVTFRRIDNDGINRVRRK